MYFQSYESTLEDLSERGFCFARPEAKNSKPDRPHLSRSGRNDPPDLRGLVYRSAPVYAKYRDPRPVLAGGGQRALQSSAHVASDRDQREFVALGARRQPF